MPTRVNRQTVDLSAYPDLTVLYLGMRVNRLYGIRTLLGFGRKISESVAGEPDGLLLHEPVYYSFLPMNMGMRQYWRDLPSLLAFARSDPHRQWWLDFLRDSGGTGFWHETYSVRGGMEAVYDDVPKPLGFGRFARIQPARGPMFGSAARLGRGPGGPPVLSETDLYGSGTDPHGS
jgi:Monooxygenase af470-like